MSRTNKADHPRERIMLTVTREPIQPDGLAPIKVLQRNDGPFIVFDPSLPLGRMTASTHKTYELALDAAWRRRRAKVA